MGAPRTFRPERAEDAEKAFREQVGDGASDGVLDEAIAGWERSRERRNGIERRLEVFLQVAGVTTTLVLANGALLTDKDRVTGLAGVIVIVALIGASIALLLAGVYGLFGSMLTFERIDPDNVLRVINRAKESDDQPALEKRVAATFLATRRTSHVADWQQARLERAMWCLLIGVLLLAVASGALATSAL